MAGRRFTLCCPDGHVIDGTLERLSGRALCTTFSRNDKGEIECDYMGETEVFWDDQRTEQRGDKDIFLCTVGDEWTIDQLTEAEIAEPRET